MTLILATLWYFAKALVWIAVGFGAGVAITEFMRPPPPPNAGAGA